MSTLLQYRNEQEISSIEEDILNHPAWIGFISGLKAEKMLSERFDKVPYLYVLRQGEGIREFYITYVRSDLSIQHQPFIIHIAPDGWYCSNGIGWGPFIEASIDSVLHFVMHCEKDQCTPLTKR